MTRPLLGRFDSGWDRYGVNTSSATPPLPSLEEIASVVVALHNSRDVLDRRLDHLGRALGVAVSAAAIEDLHTLSQVVDTLRWMAENATAQAIGRDEQMRTLTAAHESTVAAIEAKAQERADRDLEQIRRQGRRVEALERQIRDRLQPRTARAVIRRGRVAMDDG